MKRKNLIFLLAIISFICLGFIIQADFFIHKISVLENENTQLHEEVNEKSQQIKGVEEENETLRKELDSRVTFFEEEEILAKLLWCEARGSSWEGQVYTCSAILNYCERAGTTIWEAAHNPQSFEPAPYVDNATPTAMQYEVIYYVLNGGRIPDICWFRTDHYHDFGTPVCEVDGHYFSKP